MALHRSFLTLKAQEVAVAALRSWMLMPAKAEVPEAVRLDLAQLAAEIRRQRVLPRETTAVPATTSDRPQTESGSAVAEAAHRRQGWLVLRTSAADTAGTARRAPSAAAQRITQAAAEADIESTLDSRHMKGAPVVLAAEEKVAERRRPLLDLQTAAVAAVATETARH
jgi:hypothetical protein